MILYGKVVDQKTGDAVPYASIELTDQAGKYLGFGVAAGVDGSFSLDSPMMEPGTFIRLSHAAYNTVSFPFEVYQFADIFKMVQKVEDLTPVVITATKKETTNNAILIALGIGAMLFLFSKKR